MTKAIVMTASNLRVGICGIHTEIDLQIEVDDEDREEVRKILTDAFGAIYNDEVGVEFDDERTARIAREEAWYERMDRIQRRLDELK